MTYDTWKTTNPDDEFLGPDPDDLPCCWEKFSGICMRCGAGPDDECEVEREQARAAKRIVDTVASMRAPMMEEVATLIRQWGTRR